jgi:hypothetical protein
LIGKQIVYQLTIADYQVIIPFKVNHLRVCDEGIAGVTSMKLMHEEIEILRW